MYGLVSKATTCAALLGNAWIWFGWLCWVCPRVATPEKVNVVSDCPLSLVPVLPPPHFFLRTVLAHYTQQPTLRRLPLDEPPEHSVLHQGIN